MLLRINVKVNRKGGIWISLVIQRATSTAIHASSTYVSFFAQATVLWSLCGIEYMCDLNRNLDSYIVQSA